ncbi:MAG: hypothetical protein ABI454_02510 [Sphingomicrobium sp.]
MRLLTMAILVLLPTAAAAVGLQGAPATKGAASPSTAECLRTTSYYAYRQGEPLKPRKLTELPPANAYSAVYRHIGRCEAPIVVKYGVGRR